MPEMSGWDVCWKIREDEKIKNIKIIILLVASLSGSEKGALEKMNIFDYVTKPIDNNDLILKVKKAIE